MKIRSLLNPEATDLTADPPPSPEATDLTADPPPNPEATDLTPRHNGTYYTHPECIEGVPLDKVDSGHEYWERSWRNLEKVYTEELHTTQTKAWKCNVAYVREKTRRIEAILNFLQHGSFSPYQLLSKKYPVNWCALRPCYRLCATVTGLQRHGIPDPVAWLRERLAELSEDPKFDFTRTMDGFYNDEKLVALRNAHRLRAYGRLQNNRRKFLGNSRPSRPATATRRG